ncbi:hypothetical protein EUX98_g5454 [Antrodiella citrinella]|uniref:Copper transport protein n=1 Tax=Antrodiella citrinella TaxID=2447956 RepID=A0A4S4MRK4_9APHY|nr:hypothetical protein EUX98_g5454 [Antrodiella citrinella]
MLWNTQIEDTCIVFRSWHIYTITGFVLSCIAIVLLGIFYEWLREAQKNLDRRIAAQLSAQEKGKARVSTPNGTIIPPVARFSRALLYGATVFLSFFLMLVFMTYNAYLIAATVVGAAIGHYIFSPTMDIEVVLAGGVTGSKG